MATSGQTTFDPTRNQIINGALRIVGAYASGDAPRPEQISDALEALEMMLKGWQVDGLLWLRTFVRIPLVGGQNSYSIGVGSTDTIYKGMTGTTAFAQRPIKIHDESIVRIDSNGMEVPITLISRQEWESLPNKADPGTVVQAYYDPQLVLGKFYVWPTPATAVTDVVRFTVDRLTEDAGNDSDFTLDIPPEFQETVKYSLALRISSEYPPGMSADDKTLAVALYEKMISYQREPSSTYIQPGR